MKLLVNNSCVMNYKLGYNRVKLKLLGANIEIEVFSKEIETEEDKNYLGLPSVEQSWLLEIISMSHSGNDSSTL